MPASRLSANKRFLNKFARMNSTVKLLTRGGRGDARLFLERDQKRDQGKSKALEISSAKVKNTKMVLTLRGNKQVSLTRKKSEPKKNQNIDLVKAKSEVSIYILLTT